MDNIIKTLKDRIGQSKRNAEGPNDASYQYETGVLLSRNEATELLKLLPAWNSPDELPEVDTKDHFHLSNKISVRVLCREELFPGERFGRHYGELGEWRIEGVPDSHFSKVKQWMYIPE